MTRALPHSILLVLSTLFVWSWSQNSVLSNYNLQLTGVLTLLYFAFKFFLRLTSHKNLREPSTIILNAICLLLVFSTGGLTSPLFFLLDLLFFAIALLFEPFQAATAALTIITLFIFQSPLSSDTTKIINLISLALTTPLAILFSRNYLNTLEAKGQIQILRTALQTEEAKSILWIERQAKPSLAATLNTATDLLMYFETQRQKFLMPPTIISKLKSVQSDIIALYTSANNLEKSINNTSDKLKI